MNRDNLIRLNAYEAIYARLNSELGGWVSPGDLIAVGGQQMLTDVLAEIDRMSGALCLEDVSEARVLEAAE